MPRCRRLIAASAYHKLEAHFGFLEARPRLQASASRAPNSRLCPTGRLRAPSCRAGHSDDTLSYSYPCLSYAVLRNSPFRMREVPLGRPPLPHRIAIRLLHWTLTLTCCHPPFSSGLSAARPTLRRAVSCIREGTSALPHPAWHCPSNPRTTHQGHQGRDDDDFSFAVHSSATA